RHVERLDLARAVVEDQHRTDRTDRVQRPRVARRVSERAQRAVYLDPVLSVVPDEAAAVRYDPESLLRRAATADGRDNKQDRDDPGVAERQRGARARALGCARSIRCLRADEIRHIASRRRMRSAIGGCVSKSPSMARGASFSGFAKYKDAVALLATSSASLSAAILRSALANPGGYRVSRAPDASARYSRCLETANWMSIAMIGVSIASTIAMIRMTPPPPPRSRPRRPPPNAKERNIQSESRAIVPTSTVTRSITRMS